MVNKINKHYLLIAYKLLYDILALVLASFAAIILLNGLLPEFFVDSAIFLKLILLLILLIALIAYLGTKLVIDFPLERTKKNPLIPLLLVFAFLVSGNAMLKLRLWENILLTLVTLVALYQLFTLQTGSDKK